MHCDTSFCIYQHEGLCTIADETRVDHFGRCWNYIPIELSAEQLQKEKHALLLQYEHGIYP